MTDDRSANFKQANEQLADKWDMSMKAVEAWRKLHKYTWYEDNDLKSMLLVPSILNVKAGHLGGVGEYKKKNRL